MSTYASNYFCMTGTFLSEGVGGVCGTMADTGGAGGTNVDKGGGFIPSIFSSFVASECLRCGRLFCKYMMIKHYAKVSLPT